MLSYEYIQFLNQKVLEHLPMSSVRIGDKIQMRCPLCGDSKKSLTKKRGWFYLQNSSFYCFNCSTGMSGIKFLEYISGSAFEDIKKEYLKLFLKSGLNSSLSSTFEQPESEPSIFNVKQVVKPEWKIPLSQTALKYLDERLVTKAPFLKDPLYSWFSNSKQEFILIPWRLNGIDAYYQLNDFQKLTQMKYIFPKDSKKLIYGLDNIDLSWDKIIITEGVYDSLFIKNACAVGTKAITDYQLKLIKERYPHHTICVSFDNDRSGLESMAKLVKQNNDLKFFKWFNQNTKQKDINDYILYKNDANIFTNSKVLDKLIVDKLTMKMFLMNMGVWNAPRSKYVKRVIKTTSDEVNRNPEIFRFS